MPTTNRTPLSASPRNPFPIDLKCRCSAQEESLRLREFTCDPFPVPEVAEGDSYRPLRCSTH